MPQSLSKVLVHLIFSPKHREPLIGPEIRPSLHAYLFGILANLNSSSLQTGGVADHVHILLALGRTSSQADLVEEVKKSPSKWMKAGGGVPGFTWQAGYGAFSIGESQADAVIRYIQNQAEHHRKLTFQEEFRRLLERYKVAYDERYVWDSNKQWGGHHRGAYGGRLSSGPLHTQMQPAFRLFAELDWQHRQTRDLLVPRLLSWQVALAERGGVWQNSST